MSFSIALAADKVFIKGVIKFLEALDYDTQKKDFSAGDFIS